METNFWKNILGFWISVQDSEMLECNKKIATAITQQFESSTSEYKPIHEELAQIDVGGYDDDWVD